MTSDKSTRNDMIRRCISLSAKTKSRNIVERKEMRDEIVRRVNKKISERNQLKRRQGVKARKLSEAQIRDYFCRSSGQVGDGWTNEQLNSMTQIVEGDMQDRFIQHVWHDKATHQDLIWTGKVVDTDSSTDGEPQLIV